MADSYSASNGFATARSLIRTIDDYPKPGVAFRDITPLLADGPALRYVAHALLQQTTASFDAVAGVEARGFLFAGAVGVLSGSGVIPVRKAGKLPQPAHHISYAKEYGNDSLEVSAEVRPGMRVLLLDDILATGGTLKAAADLIAAAGAQVVEIGVVLELAGLDGRSLVPQAKALFMM